MKYFILLMCISISISQENNTKNNYNYEKNNNFEWWDALNYPQVYYYSGGSSNGYTVSPIPVSDDLGSITENADFMPAHGWILIDYNFGNPNYGSSFVPDLPYMILYNKYSGLLRAFVLNATEHISSEVILKARFEDATSTNLNFSTGIAEAQDRIPLPNQRILLKNDIVDGFGSVSGRWEWLYIDIPTSHDRLIHTKEHINIFFSIHHKDVYDIELNGTIDLQETTQHTTSVNSTVGTINDAVKKVESTYATYDKWKGHVKNHFNKEKTIFSAKLKNGPYKASISIKKQTVDVSNVLDYFNYAGVLFGIADYFMAGPGTAPAPMTFEGEIGLNGTMELNQSLADFKIRLPGSKITYTVDENGLPIAIDPWAPINDISLGLINLKTTPHFDYLEYEQYEQAIDISSSNNLEKWESFKLTSEIEYYFDNTYSSLEEIKGAVTFKVPFIMNEGVDEISTLAKWIEKGFIQFENVQTINSPVKDSNGEIERENGNIITEEINFITFRTEYMNLEDLKGIVVNVPIEDTEIKNKHGFETEVNVKITAKIQPNNVNLDPFMQVLTFKTNSTNKNHLQGGPWTIPLKVSVNWDQIELNWQTLFEDGRMSKEIFIEESLDGYTWNKIHLNRDIYEDEFDPWAKTSTYSTIDTEYFDSFSFEIDNPNRDRMYRVKIEADIYQTFSNTVRIGKSTQPENIYPANNAIVTTNPEIKWLKASLDPEMNHELWLNGQIHFISNNSDKKLFTNLNTGSYSWKVRGIKNGVPTNWSSVSSFNLYKTPQLSGLYNSNSNPKLTWVPINGISTVKIYRIYNNGAETNIHTISNGDNFFIDYSVNSGTSNDDDFKRSKAAPGGGNNHKIIKYRILYTHGSYISPFSTTLQIWGSISGSGGGDDDFKSDLLKGDNELAQNHPNPFNPTTRIAYNIKKSEVVRITVYNSLGKKITTLVNSIKNAGNHSVNWDASNYSSGVYYYQIITPSYTQTKKMLLIK